jgi:uncharacterized membrane protein
MELILLLGVAVLFVFLLLTWSRVTLLERQVEGLRGALAERPSAPAEAPDPLPDRSSVAAPPRGTSSRALLDRLEQGWQAEPEPEDEQPWDEPRETLGGFFERWVGGRLMIWVGGIALAVAGVLLVRYSVQIGLITPSVQMGIAASFGLLLLALGELARSRADWALDRRVSQALVGAGILVLYATTYGSLVLHQLISNGTAFGLMAMVTGAALILALRH